MSRFTKQITSYWQQFRTVVRNEYGSIFTDAGVILVLVLALLIYSTLYSLAYGTQVLRNVPIGVIDMSNTSTSRQLINTFNAGPNVYVAYEPGDMDEAKHLFYDREIYGVVYIPSDYEEKLGFHGTFVTVEEAYQSNLSLLKREQKKMHDFLQKAYIAQMDQKIKEQVTFAPEIPWLERETQALYKLNRTLAEKIADAVCECGKIMLDAVRTADMVETKEGHANFVTVYDKKVQETLRKKLLEILPEAVFVGEEDDVHVSIKKGFAFIVDPIDGTTNFIKDYHVSAISVGLAKDGEKYIGVVYNPYLDEMFTAERGKGAFLNGRPIHVSRNPLSEGIVLFGTAPYYEELSKKSFQMAYAYFKKALDVRRSGSAAIDLCSIAAGRAELYFELRLSPWDFAAGALIVEEAGGVVTTVEGGAVTLGQKCSVLATNGRCGRLE